MSDTPRTDKEIERHDGEDSFQHYIDFAKGLERELAYKEASLFEAAKLIQRLREDLTIEHQNFLKAAEESQMERDRAIAAEKGGGESMRDFEVQARICPECFDDHEADKECNVMDGMRCPNCGSSNTSALNLGDGYGDCWCADCKQWCGFEEPPHTPNPAVRGRESTSVPCTGVVR